MTNNEISESLRKKYEYINLPKQQWNVRFSGIEYAPARLKIRKYCDGLHENIVDYGLFFYGPWGTGKSGAAAVVAKYAMAYGYMSYWINYDQLPDLYTGDNSTQFSDGVSLLSRIKTVDLLIIDEIYIKPVSKFKQNFPVECLESIIRYRNHSSKATIITSNQSTADLVDPKISKATEGLIGVMPEAFVSIKFDGDNLRIKKSKERNK